MIMAELSAIRSNCPEQFADNLDHLLEKIRYSASDLSDVSSARTIRFSLFCLEISEHRVTLMIRVRFENQFWRSKRRFRVGMCV